MARLALALMVILPFALGSSRPVQVPTKEIAPGVQMPVLSIGIGGQETARAAQIVASWLKLGGRAVDTAMVYRDQGVIPEELAKAGISRKDVFITTKIPGCFAAARAIENNLKQLKTDYIDLLLIHSPTLKSNCHRTWSVLEDYHRRGILRAIGVSNFDRPTLQNLLETARFPPAVNQIELSVLNYDSEAISFAKAHNISIEAYSPVGRAGESGNITGNAVIKAVAAKHNVSSYQVALKWILQHGHLATFQSSSEAHQASDADVFGFELTTSEMEALDAVKKTNDFVSGTELEVHV